MDLIPNLLQRQDNLNLTKPINLEEVKIAVEDMEEDKAPGPDGFIARLLKFHWDIVYKYLHKMVMKSQNCNNIGGSTNSGFLALIPKEKDALSFDRF